MIAGLVHGGELSELVGQVAYPLHFGSKRAAAQIVADYTKQETTVKNDAQGLMLLAPFLQFLLDQQRYVDAASLLWTPNLFSGEPKCVQEVWDELFKSALIAFPGAASCGKSYNVGVWAYLDWRRDPYYTNFQIVGPSEAHLEKNIFSHIAKLHRSAAIPGPGDVVQLGITLDTVERKSGIFGLVAPTGRRAAGRLQGVKVEPRAKPHPQFGPLSRLRVFLEEAENIPVGIFEDLVNVVANVRGTETFKAMAAYNPKDQSHPIAGLVEPLDGFHSIDLDKDYVWNSKRGWRVLRLDAYRSDNVILGTEKYFGLQTKEGLERIIAQAGGVGAPGYFSMARGWYAPTGVDLAVVPAHLLNDIYGEFKFNEPPIPFAGVDVALEGGDNAILVLGRMGLSSGWEKVISLPDGQGTRREFNQFKDQFAQPIRKEVLQIDQVFKLPKGDTIKSVAEIRRLCEGAGVGGNRLGVDRTGNGAGVHDLLVAQFSAATKGFNGSWSPREQRILQEDKELASDEYSDLLSEGWYRVRKFIEFGLLKFGPTVAREPLIQELTGRRMRVGGKKTKVEPKKDYKSRGNRSPDTADALVIAVDAASQSMSGPPSSTNGTSREFASDHPQEQRVSVTDKQEYL